MNTNMRLIKIFDTTLRDGEQSPGASMTLEEKVRIAIGLEKLGVEIIEAGFPAASKGDFTSVQAVAKQITTSIVCGLARANQQDITTAYEALRVAPIFRIHTFIATSTIHMERKLKMTPEQVLERAVQSVSLARNYTNDVEFSPEDAGRSEIDFLCKVIESVINAGATTINIPDTVGYTTPIEFGSLIALLIKRIPNSDKAIFSVHCHNDLGLAVANSLSAIANGACQVECTINGIGERAGNASLEEIVMALKTRSDFYKCATNIDTTQLVPMSKLISSVTGFMVQPNKAIVGANAFSHEAGIHQDGVIKHRETYEIMRAEDVGWDSNKLVLGKHSGRNAFITKLSEMGVTFTNEEEKNSAFLKFKEVADMKHEITDFDLQAIVTQSQIQEERYSLISLSAKTESSKPAHATITLSDQGVEKSSSAFGDGPVAAVFAAIESLVQSKATLLLYSIGNVTSGIDAIGEVMVRLSKNNVITNGKGANTDIITASALAYINALNKLTLHEQKVHAQDAQFDATYGI
ncbi:MAG: 2-isopropylmalate synthase [Methylacidiphilales bacterium]|nr:2-isopropylmalate synthase [Candidatus Methylacidiphilales bacterium]